MDFPNIQSLATMEKLSRIESVPRHNIVLRATETKSPQNAGLQLLLLSLTLYMLSSWRHNFPVACLLSSHMPLISLSNLLKFVTQLKPIDICEVSCNLIAQDTQCLNASKQL